MTNLLSAFTDNVGTGAFTFILGVAVIFFGMIVLVLAVSLVGKIVSGVSEKPAKKPKNEVVEEVAAVPVATSDDEIPEDVRVAIIAAIAAYYTDSGAKNEFKVRKIKKI